MPRKKGFDPERALAKAMGVFWRLGYESASTETLMKAMGIARQSLYDTFGDKRALYLKALAYYRDRTNGDMQRMLQASPSVKEGFAKLLFGLAAETREQHERGCLLLSANLQRDTRDAAIADFIIVVARNGVFVVDSKARGLKISPMSAMDLTRKLYVVEFSNTPAEEIGAATDLPRALDIATAALAAELVGGMQRTLDITVEYAKTRKQFGKPIGMFQAVQHQCADMYLETESSRSAVYYAGWALGENSPDAATSVSIAKMYASDAGRTVGNRGIQIHGGMGFTWENDLHLFYRRAKATETAFGDATFHRERIASMVIDSGSASAKSA